MAQHPHFSGENWGFKNGAILRASLCFGGYAVPSSRACTLRRELRPIILIPPSMTAATDRPDFIATHAFYTLQTWKCCSKFRRDVIYVLYLYCFHTHSFLLNIYEIMFVTFAICQHGISHSRKNSIILRRPQCEKWFLVRLG